MTGVRTCALPIFGDGVQALEEAVGAGNSAVAAGVWRVDWRDEPAVLRGRREVAVWNRRRDRILWADGGGWRPYENNINSRDYEETFAMMARLSGLVPTVGVVSGRCFAGNANLAGLCDTLIATPKAALGMGGPPLVEAALGLTLTPEELGPAEMHEACGAIDVLVADEQEAIDCVRRYLEYFRGADGQPGSDPDTSVLRTVVPENQIGRAHV